MSNQLVINPLIADSYSSNRMNLRERVPSIVKSQLMESPFLEDDLAQMLADCLVSLPLGIVGDGELSMLALAAQTRTLRMELGVLESELAKLVTVPIDVAGVPLPGAWALLPSRHRQSGTVKPIPVLPWSDAP